MPLSKELLNLALRLRNLTLEGHYHLVWPLWEIILLVWEKESAILPATEIKTDKQKMANWLQNEGIELLRQLHSQGQDSKFSEHLQTILDRSQHLWLDKPLPERTVQLPSKHFKASENPHLVRWTIWRFCEPSPDAQNIRKKADLNFLWGEIHAFIFNIRSLGIEALKRHLTQNLDAPIHQVSHLILAIHTLSKINDIREDPTWEETLPLLCQQLETVSSGTLIPCEFIELIQRGSEPDANVPNTQKPIFFDDPQQVAMLKFLIAGVSLNLSGLPLLTDELLSHILKRSMAVLENLDVSGCVLLTNAIFRDISECPRLKNLFLSGTRVTQLSSRFGFSLEFPQLESLKVNQCKSLVKININAPNLQYLSALGCSSLTETNTGGKHIKTLLLPETKSLEASSVSRLMDSLDTNQGAVLRGASKGNRSVLAQLPLETRSRAWVQQLEQAMDAVFSLLRKDRLLQLKEKRDPGKDLSFTQPDYVILTSFLRERLLELQVHEREVEVYLGALIKECLSQVVQSVQSEESGEGMPPDEGNHLLSLVPRLRRGWPALGGWASIDESMRNTLIEWIDDFLNDPLRFSQSASTLLLVMRGTKDVVKYRRILVMLITLFVDLPFIQDKGFHETITLETYRQWIPTIRFVLEYLNIDDQLLKIVDLVSDPTKLRTYCLKIIEHESSGEELKQCREILEYNLALKNQDYHAILVYLYGYLAQRKAEHREEFTNRIISHIGAESKILQFVVLYVLLELSEKNDDLQQRLLEFHTHENWLYRLFSTQFTAKCNLPLLDKQKRLIGLLKDPVRKIRTTAMKFLCRNISAPIHDPEQLSILKQTVCEWLESFEQRERLLALEAIEKYQLMDEPIEKSLLKSTEDPVPSIRILANRLISNRAPERTSETVQAFASLMQLNYPPKIPKGAVIITPREEDLTNPNNSLSDICRRYRAHEWNLICRAMDLFVKINPITNPSREYDFLAIQLTHPIPAIRQQAIQCIRILWGRKKLPQSPHYSIYLLNLLGDENLNVFREIKELLDSFNVFNSIESFLLDLSNSPNIRLSLAALFQVLKHKPEQPESILKLRAYFNAIDPKIREIAYQTLLYLIPSAHNWIEEIKTALKDPHWKIRLIGLMIIIKLYRTSLKSSDPDPSTRTTQNPLFTKDELFHLLKVLELDNMFFIRAIVGDFKKGTVGSEWITFILEIDSEDPFYTQLLTTLLTRKKVKFRISGFEKLFKLVPYYNCPDSDLREGFRDTSLEVKFLAYVTAIKKSRMTQNIDHAVDFQESLQTELFKLLQSSLGPSNPWVDRLTALALVQEIMLSSQGHLKQLVSQDEIQKLIKPLLDEGPKSVAFIVKYFKDVLFQQFFEKTEVQMIEEQCTEDFVYLNFGNDKIPEETLIFLIERLEDLNFCGRDGFYRGLIRALMKKYLLQILEESGQTTAHNLTDLVFHQTQCSETIKAQLASCFSRDESLIIRTILSLLSPLQKATPFIVQYLFKQLNSTSCEVRLCAFETLFETHDLELYKQAIHHLLRRVSSLFPNRDPLSPQEILTRQLSQINSGSIKEEEIKSEEKEIYQMLARLGYYQPELMKWCVHQLGTKNDPDRSAAITALEFWLNQPTKRWCLHHLEKEEDSDRSVAIFAYEYWTNHPTFQNDICHALLMTRISNIYYQVPTLAWIVLCIEKSPEYVFTIFGRFALDQNCRQILGKDAPLLLDGEGPESATRKLANRPASPSLGNLVGTAVKLMFFPPVSEGQPPPFPPDEMKKFGQFAESIEQNSAADDPTSRMGSGAALPPDSAKNAGASAAEMADSASSSSSKMAKF